MSAYRFIEALRDSAVRIPPANVMTGRQVLRHVADAHGIPMPALLGDRRFPRLVDARQDAALRLKEMGWTLTQIGDLMNRDHTSILNLLRRAKK